MSKHYIEDCNTLKLCNKENWTLQGYSKAGGRTCFYIKPLKICFDAGMSIKKKPIATFLTHKHTDHTGMLIGMSCRRLSVAKGQETLYGSPVFLPEAAMKPVTQYFKAFYMLSFDDDGIYDYIKTYKTEDYWRMQGLQPFVVAHGDMFTIPGVENIQVEVLTAYHNTTSNGYGLSRVKKKLKKDYLPLTKTKEGRDEIKKLRLSGTQIDETVIEPQLVLYCDSTIDNLKKHNEWKKYPVVVVECTGFPHIHNIKEMTERHHSHLDQLLPFIRKYKEKHWVLIHTSCTLDNEQLKEHETRLRDEGLNVNIWIS